MLELSVNDLFVIAYYYLDQRYFMYTHYKTLLKHPKTARCQGTAGGRRSVRSLRLQEASLEEMFLLKLGALTNGRLPNRCALPAPIAQRGGGDAAETSIGSLASSTSPNKVVSGASTCAFGGFFLFFFLNQYLQLVSFSQSCLAA